MDEASFVILALLGMVAFNAYRQGQLGAWLRAKFLNANQEPLPVAPSTNATLRPASFVQSMIRGVLGSPLASAPKPSGVFGEDRGDHRHAGVDYPVPSGTNVLAAGGGRVAYSGAMGGYGLAVDVDHGNGLVTRYGHLSRLLVKVGEIVNAGQLLGLSGSTGRSTGPHLHFEVRENGTPIDPLGALAPAALLAAPAPGSLS
jgi:murein DD-endopeptidase MepM/ murein hydrolase activator NlpD